MCGPQADEWECFARSKCIHYPKLTRCYSTTLRCKSFPQTRCYNSGFGEILLSKQSCRLTAFITPIGFNKLLFGISSAPKHFQKRMFAILSGLEGVVVKMDDILVFDKDQAEHDAWLFKIMTSVKEAGATLNPDKCVVSKSSSYQLHIMWMRMELATADPNKI